MHIQLWTTQSVTPHRSSCVFENSPVCNVWSCLSVTLYVHFLACEYSVAAYVKMLYRHCTGIHSSYEIWARMDCKANALLCPPPHLHTHHSHVGGNLYCAYRKNMLLWYLVWLTGFNIRVPLPVRERKWGSGVGVKCDECVMMTYFWLVVM